MIWLNGEIREAEGAISANDRGLLLGEAVFETLLVHKGVPQFWDAHMARLATACAAFSFPMPYNDAKLRDGVKALLALHEKNARQVLRLTVTGGAAGRGLVPAHAEDGTWLMQISDAAPPPAYLHLHESAVPVLARGASSGIKQTPTSTIFWRVAPHWTPGQMRRCCSTNSVAWAGAAQAMFLFKQASNSSPRSARGHWRALSAHACWR